jgi:hypothetical protein
MSQARDANMKQTALLLILAGAILVVVGLALLLAGKVPFLGRLPGDIHVRGRNFTFSFPLATCIVLSLLLTLVLNIILRWTRK